MLFFTGRAMHAPDLYRLGVVQEVVPREQLLPVALEIAREIATKSPVAVAMTKAAFNVVEEMPHRDGYRYEQSVTYELSKTDDAREARAAFLERRKPQYHGR